MALTNKQLIDLGFKPSIRGRKGINKSKKYDSLVYPINETDFLYTGFNPYSKSTNYKTIWKSFKNSGGERITYQVVNLGETGYTELKEYIRKTLSRNESNELIHSAAFKEEFLEEPTIENIELIADCSQTIPEIDG